MSDVCVCGCGGLEAMKNTQWFILLFGKRFAIVCFLCLCIHFLAFDGMRSGLTSEAVEKIVKLS